MEYREWSIACLNEKEYPAKAQRRKENETGPPLLWVGPQHNLFFVRRFSRNVPFFCSSFASLRLCGKLLLALSLTIVASAQPHRSMAPADILRVANVADAQISPSGDWVVYSVSTVEGDETRNTLWLVRTDSEPNPPVRNPDQRREFRPRNPTTPLLPPGWNASNPRWSPDGKIVAFLANHEDQKGIWIVALDRRQPHFVAQLRDTNFFITYAGESFAWSPDSKSLAYISATDESNTIEEAAAKHDDPRVINRIQYKSRTSFSDHSRTHLWLVDIDKPEPRQLTSGLFYDHAITFSPRGDEIAFLSNHELDPDANNNSDIFVVDLHGQVRQITNTKGCEYDPVWSPDGKWIAYIATKRDLTTIDSVAEDTHVWVISAAGENRRELTAEQDRRARNPQWSGDGQFVFYLAGDRGCTTAFRVPASGGRPRQIIPDALEGGQLYFAAGDVGPKPSLNHYQVTSLTVAQRRNPGVVGGQRENDPGIGWQMVFTLSSPTLASEVWLYPGGGSDAFRLTAHNGPVRSYDMIEPEEFRFRSVDGTSIQAWLMKPVGWREDRKYPLILSIHGGPHGMSGYAFNPNFQVFAARGYAVLYLNPRGSSGYGQRFSDGTLNEWGGGDYRDLMAGVDEVLKRYSWIDPDRLGVTGGSYGGFMTNWIITQTPRFKAAVATASVSNLISFYSTSLYQDLIHAEFGGFPWDNYDLLWQWSPLRYSRQVQTPTLFIHGEQDNDVHITQAEEMYMALKRRGVETVLVRYPREGHGLREPRHRVDALERTLAWFDRFLK